METINEHCGAARDARGVVRLAIRNAGSLNILGTGVMGAVRAGLEALGSDGSVRAVVLTGESERAFVGGADVDEMAAGAGAAAGAVAGAAAGAAIGNAIQNRNGIGYAIYVRMSDGRETVVTQDDLGDIRVGSAVRVSNGRAYLR